MRVAKWGNSLAVRLPKSLVEELALQAGDQIDIVDATHDRLTLEKRGRRDVAIERMRSRRLVLPLGYTFDRDEANAR